MEPHDSNLAMPHTVLQPVGLPTRQTSPAADPGYPRTDGGRVCEGILDAIGQTPLIRLNRFLPGARFHLYAKLEALNPGGSIKDRPAVAILEAALAAGQIGPGTVVVESSSGNMGIGLAQACRYHGLRFLCVVDPRTAPANLEVLRAYGAEIDHVLDPDPATGEFLQARIHRVQELLGQIPDSFWPNQYANEGNSSSHYRTTMSEVVAALGRVDFVFVPTSTCGTVRGCGEYVRDHDLETRIIAVDAYGSQIFSDVKARRMVPGLGAGLRPPLCDLSVIHEYVHVNDVDCIRGCRRLVDREAVLAGGSSGGVLAAVEKMRGQIPDGAVCVAILPDRGERYLKTVYSDAWVRENFGDIDLSDQDAAEKTPAPADRVHRAEIRLMPAGPEDMRRDRLAKIRHRDFLGLRDFTRAELEELLALAASMKSGQDRTRYLDGKNLGMLFTVSSTRTRISFQVAARHLGAQAEHYSPSELQMSNNETLIDTAEVMSRYLDAIVIRLYDMNAYGKGRESLMSIAEHASVPVVNALDDKEHPCQVMADVLTMQEKLGPGFRKKKVVLSWAYAKRQKSPGVTHSMMAAAGLLGMNLTVAFPKGFEPDEEYTAFAREAARQSGGTVEFCHDLDEAAEGADVIYAKSWKSLVSSTEEDAGLRQTHRESWRVSQSHFDRANPGALFMDCMPLIRGDEATAEVVDGSMSVRYDEAENRLHVQKAILASLL